MSPLEFLKEEHASVLGALRETLRHDYGPQRSHPFFEECSRRLAEIKTVIDEDPGMDRAAIAVLMQSLSSIGSRISLIERSHLGEFSWPFSGVIRRIADAMFTQKTVIGDLPPIVHVVAEGMDYQIVNDDLSSEGMARIIIVAFPRQLKHHVLVHAIFGHELGHTMYDFDRSGGVIHRRAMPVLRRGVLQDVVQARDWLASDDAPAAIRNADPVVRNAVFSDQTLTNWRQEILSDLFGLVLFGPAFVAAHRTVIEAMCPRPDAVELEDSTHPPYPIRQRILARALARLGWAKPITPASDRIVHEAEVELIGYLTDCVQDAWFDLIDDHQLDELLEAIKAIFEPYPDIAYSPPKAVTLGELVRRLSLERPPIDQHLDEDGRPVNRPVPAAHCLYAGWTFWFGRDALLAEARETDPEVQKLTFLELNRLCDQAILQQEAIDMVLKASEKPK